MTRLQLVVFIMALIVVTDATASSNPNVDMAYRMYDRCMKTARTIEAKNFCAETLNAMVNIYSHDDEEPPPPPPDYQPMVVCQTWSGGFTSCY